MLNKKKFEITIEETVSESFVVYAENSEEALKMVDNKYNSGEFVLSPGNLMSKQMAITIPKNKATEWIEF